VGLSFVDTLGQELIDLFAPIATMDLLPAVLIQLFLVYMIAWVLGEIFIRFGMMAMVGQIIAGVLISNLAIGDFTLASALNITWHPDDPSLYYEIFDILAELGVIFLLFKVGLETKVGEIQAVGKSSIMVAVLGVVLPFVLGFGLIFIYDGYINSSSEWMIHALFMGAAMVATSVGITAKAIADMSMMDTIESKIILGAAVIDDILAMVVLAVVMGIADAQTGTGGLDLVSIGITITLSILFVLVVLLIASHAVPRVKEYQMCRIDEKGIHCEDKNWPMQIQAFPLTMLTCLFLSALASVLGLAAIIGAFLAGMLFAEYSHQRLEERFEGLTEFLLPFFFVFVGMRVELSGFVDVIPLAIVTIILAIIGKYYGCYAGVRISDKSLEKDSADIVGIGMIPRGEVGIIVAAIGLTSGAMSHDMYTVVMLMSIVTALVAPPLLKRSFDKKYKHNIAKTPSLKT